MSSFLYASEICGGSVLYDCCVSNLFFRLSPCQPSVVAPTPLVPLVTAGTSAALLLEILRLLQNLLPGINTLIYTHK